MSNDNQPRLGTLSIWAGEDEYLLQGATQARHSFGTPYGTPYGRRTGLGDTLRGERRNSASVGLLWRTIWRLFVAPLLRVTCLVKCQHALGSGGPTPPGMHFGYHCPDHPGSGLRFRR